MLSVQRSARVGWNAPVAGSMHSAQPAGMFPRRKFRLAAQPPGAAAWVVRVADPWNIACNRATRNSEA